MSHGCCSSDFGMGLDSCGINNFTGCSTRSAVLTTCVQGVKEQSLKDKNKNTKKKVTRLDELNTFYDKLNATLQKVSAQSTENKKLLEKFKQVLGKGYLTIIFDCKKPSYYGLNNKMVQIQSNDLIKLLKSSDNCSEQSDNLWHFHGNKNLISTYDNKAKNLSSSVLPMERMMTFFHDLGLCDNFMKLMKHPSYFNKAYKKPPQCLAKEDVSKKGKDNDELPARPEAPKFGFHPQFQHFQQQQFNPWARFAQFQQFQCRPGGG
ncbi:unnamed protein product [Brachionus calyciflorus]|uniref:Uncharacterized protein n=1 Tax=Brachionus calyciflorus TaxID=104777 RepID=A0A813M8T6_9BILA|nr:unnamed protein product [Brachionus calyciflorus]